MNLLLSLMWISCAGIVLAKNIIPEVPPPVVDAEEDERDHVHPRATLQSRQFVPGNINELETDYWRNNAKMFVEKQVNRVPNTNRAKNVIMFLGDGMSIPTVAAARVYMAGEEAELSFEKFPYVGLSKTYCVDKQVADSACSATAYLSGVKGNYGTIGVNARVTENDCTQGLDVSTHTSSIAKWAQDAGKSTGIVTTTRVTHASPAGVYANTANRDWEDDYEVVNSSCDPDKVIDIAQQLIHGDVGKNLKVILGGGRREFINRTSTDDEGKAGKRRDGRNLIGEWQSMDGRRQYVWNKTELMSANPANTDYLLGLFEDSHNMYHLDVVANNAFDKEPTLKEMVQKAIEFLSKDTNGYFLFVEGGRIDHAHHDTVAKKALEETVQFSEAIDYARQNTNEADTLIVVTSDHAHTMSYSGYATRGTDILGTAGTASDGKRYFTLSYANGPGYNTHVDPATGRVDPMSFGETAGSNTFPYPATAPLSSETHGGDDVGVYASGPWAHLFTGNYEQNTIPHMMAYAACIGKGLTACAA